MKRSKSRSYNRIPGTEECDDALLEVAAGIERRFTGRRRGCFAGKRLAQRLGR